MTSKNIEKTHNFSRNRLSFTLHESRHLDIDVLDSLAEVKVRDIHILHQSP